MVFYGNFLSFKFKRGNSKYETPDEAERWCTFVSDDPILLDAPQSWSDIIGHDAPPTFVARCFLMTSMREEQSTVLLVHRSFSNILLSILYWIHEIPGDTITTFQAETNMSLVEVSSLILRTL